MATNLENLIAAKAKYCQALADGPDTGFPNQYTIGDESFTFESLLDKIKKLNELIEYEQAEDEVPWQLETRGYC